jgi:glycosyltransferase involved in cell wall biosynthesis
MNIIATCKMGAGTFEAKFVPLSKLKNIDTIYVLRKEEGKRIQKLKYIILPKICRISFLSIFITPMLLSYNVIKYKASFILAYHVIPHAFFAFIASVITRRPFIVGQTGIKVQGLSEKKLFGKIILFILKKASYLNVPGNFSRNHWINKGIVENKINLLHSTIDTDYYVNTNSKKEFDFIFLGRLAEEKNIQLIIHAFSLICINNISPSMVVVGDGPERNNLENLAKKLNIEDKVSFVGFQDDVKTWLNKARIFIMASVSEGMPTALMQAMACELICISSKVGNISDLIKHEKNGYLFESKNEEELSKLMLKSYSNVNLSIKLGVQARKDIILNHSYSSAIKKWNTLIENIN